MQMPGHLAAIRSGRGAPSGDAWALVWAEAQQQQHGQELPAALKQLESVWRDCSGGIYLDFVSQCVWRACSSRMGAAARLSAAADATRAAAVDAKRTARLLGHSRSPPPTHTHTA
jgi:hypothetical protein